MEWRTTPARDVYCNKVQMLCVFHNLHIYSPWYSRDMIEYVAKHIKMLLLCAEMLGIVISKTPTVRKILSQIFSQTKVVTAFN